MSADTDYRVPSKLAKQYLQRNEGVTMAESTADTYDRNLTEFIEHLHTNDLTVETATTDDIRLYIESCVRRGNRESTISNKLTAIINLYEFTKLHTDIALALDPLELQQINTSQYQTPPKIEREALSREEIRRLLDSFNNIRDRLICTVLIETGLRNSDVRNLRLEDIRDDHIHVRNPKGGTPYTVPITPRLRFQLRQWINHHRPAYEAASKSEYVFPSRSGERIKTNGTLTRIIREAAERAGIQRTIGQVKVPTNSEGDQLQTKICYRVTPHTLRHSCITMMAESGVDLPHRQLVAGHSNPSTTMGYDHSGEDPFNQVRERFDPPT